MDFKLDRLKIVKRKTVRNVRKGKSRYNLTQDKSVNRFCQNASRLEHVNVKNRNKSKKGN